MKKGTIAFIFARGGSKGIPGKNLKMLNGTPLIGHAINLAKKINIIDGVYVSTDCEKISEISSDYGAEIIHRPKELATDNAPEWLAWQHAIRTYIREVGYFQKFLSLPPTAPLRAAQDIVDCVDALKPGVDLVLTITEALRNPWFNIVKSDKNNFVRLLNENNKFSRRQDCPKCFDITTLAYVSRPDHILNSKNLWHGKVKGLEIPRYRSIDIDTPLDFEIAEFLMKKYPT